MLISRIAWILFFIFVILCSSHHWTGHQALGLSNIINRLVDVFPFKVIIKLSHQTVASFLEAMTYLTCNFQEAALLNMVCDALGIFLCQSRSGNYSGQNFFQTFSDVSEMYGGVLEFFKTFFEALRSGSKRFEAHVFIMLKILMKFGKKWIHNFNIFSHWMANVNELSSFRQLSLQHLPLPSYLLHYVCSRKTCQISKLF